MAFQSVLKRERDADNARFAFWRKRYLNLAMVTLNDFAGDCQSQPEANHPGGEERLGAALRGFGLETGAGVAHLDPELGQAIGTFGEVNGDIGILGVRLEGIEDNLGKGVAQRLVIAADFPR